MARKRKLTQTLTVKVSAHSLNWLKERAAANGCTLDELLDSVLIGVEDFERWRGAPLWTVVGYRHEQAPAEK